MAPTHTPQQEMLVRNEYDVIVLRQEVRQLARSLGLGLVQQAKIATAISTIARTLIAEDGAHFMLQVIQPPAPPALEIACVPKATCAPADIEQYVQELHLSEVRSLVDEINLTTQGTGTLLILRMWLGK